MTIDWKNALEAELSALRTAAIADAAEIERIQIAAKRYETLRTLNPRQFADLYAKNLETGVAFDELVDGLSNDAGDRSEARCIEVVELGVQL